jgi:hypothetical protein
MNELSQSLIQMILNNFKLSLYNLVPIQNFQKSLNSFKPTYLYRLLAPNANALFSSKKNTNLAAKYA